MALLPAEECRLPSTQCVDPISGRSPGPASRPRLGSKRKRKLLIGKSAKPPRSSRNQISNRGGDKLCAHRSLARRQPRAHKPPIPPRHSHQPPSGLENTATVSSQRNKPDT